MQIKIVFEKCITCIYIYAKIIFAIVINESKNEKIKNPWGRGNTKIRVTNWEMGLMKTNFLQYKTNE